MRARRMGRRSHDAFLPKDRQIDVAIAPLEGRPPAQVQFVPLVRMPLVLLVPRKMKIASAAELWAQGAVLEPLITLPEAETTRAHPMR